MFAKKKNEFDQTLAKINKDDVSEILRRLSESSVKRFRQELSGEFDDMLDREVRKYRSKVARRSWRTAQKWCRWNDDGPTLMPDYARIYYRKGKTEVLLIEYPPQVRLMRFRGELAQRDHASEDQDVGSATQIHNYALALPYMVFMFKFVDGLYQDVLVSFNDRPLKKLKERPLRPFLSNVDNTLKLCVGNDFPKNSLEKGNIVQQAALVLSHFWQTVYCDEWGQHFWEYKKHFSGNSKLCNLAAWQAASTENSLFVIEGVDWLPHTEDDYGSMLVRLLEGDSDDALFQQEIYDDVEEELLTGVKQVFQETVKNTEHKIKSHDLDAMAVELLERLKIALAKEG